jgi:hypothetical protein
MAVKVAGRQFTRYGSKRGARQPDPDNRLPCTCTARSKGRAVNSDPTSLSIFLSHNSADKEYVRRLAAAVALAGARVWFDEWEVRPGDSIPGAINEGLSAFDTFALVWSEAAAMSRWVETEMQAAVTRWVAEPSVRLVPVVMDATPLPPILRPICYIDGTDGDHLRVARQLLGIESATAFRMAVQGFIDEAGLDFREFPGVGVHVACPRCGATTDKLEGWSAIDEKRDDQYVGARCRECGWSDGSEV